MDLMTEINLYFTDYMKRHPSSRHIIARVDQAQLQFADSTIVVAWLSPFGTVAVDCHGIRYGCISTLEQVRQIVEPKPAVGCVSLVIVGEYIVGLRCPKRNSIILPGGKLQAGETFKQAAARELLEGTGLVAQTQRLVFGGMSADGVYCYTFLTTISAQASMLLQQAWRHDNLLSSIVFTTWAELIATSHHKAYIELLHEVLQKDWVLC